MPVLATPRGRSLLISLGGVSSPASSLYLGQAATRCFVPDTKTLSALGWNCRTVHYARDDIINPVLVLGNWYAHPPQGELTQGGTRTSKASFEYPIGTIAGQVKWGGATSVVEADGATTLSDPTAGVFIPKGSLFATRWYQVNQFAVQYLSPTLSKSMNVALGDAVNSSGIDQTMSGTVVDNGNACMVPPQGILSMTRLPAIGTIGSSRMSGLKDVTLDSTGDTGYARMFGGNFAYMDYAVGGDQMIVAAGAAGAKRMALLKAYCTHLWLDPGLNDLNAGKTAAQVETALLSMASAWPGGLSRVIMNDEAAWTTSTDGWVTTTNQTVKSFEAQRVLLNTWVAALSGYNQLVKPNAFDGNGTNAQFWNNTAVGGMQFTPDGTHENTAACVAIRNAGLFNPTLVHLP